jgi:hypothetical protein
MKERSAIVLALLAGCVAGSVASREVSKPATAAQQQRWEYICVEKEDADDLQAYANQAGAAGWQMVGSGGPENRTWCFKQPL